MPWILPEKTTTGKIHFRNLFENDDFCFQELKKKEKTYLHKHPYRIISKGSSLLTFKIGEGDDKDEMAKRWAYVSDVLPTLTPDDYSKKSRVKHNLKHIEDLVNGKVTERLPHNKLEFTVSQSGIWSANLKVPAQTDPIDDAEKSPNIPEEDESGVTTRQFLALINSKPDHRRGSTGDLTQMEPFSPNFADSHEITDALNLENEDMMHPPLSNAPLYILDEPHVTRLGEESSPKKLAQGNQPNPNELSEDPPPSEDENPEACQEEDIVPRKRGLALSVNQIKISETEEKPRHSFEVPRTSLDEPEISLGRLSEERERRSFEGDEITPTQKKGGFIKRFKRKWGNKKNQEEEIDHSVNEGSDSDVHDSEESDASQDEGGEVVSKKERINLKSIRQAGLRKRIAVTCLIFTFLTTLYRYLHFDAYVLLLLISYGAIYYFYINKKQFIRSTASRGMKRRVAEVKQWGKQFWRKADPKKNE